MEFHKISCVETMNENVGDSSLANHNTDKLKWIHIYHKNLIKIKIKLMLRKCVEL